VGGPNAWRPRGRERIAILWSETDCYGAGARYGEHGGASLAEVVAPALLIAARTLADDSAAEGHPDAGLEVRALPRPAFWDLELPRASAARRGMATAAPQTKQGRAKPRPEPHGQVPLPLEVRPAPPAAPVPAAASGALAPDADKLGRSALFAAMLARRPKVKKDVVLRAVSVLLAHEGQMEPELFASRTGELPNRVGGAVARMQEVLNAEGYEVLRLDLVEKRVVLDRAKLAELFFQD
jgi:hypothetical protein